MTTDDVEAVDLATFFAVRLAAYRVPHDVISLLMYGDERGNVPPGALVNTLKDLRSRGWRPVPEGWTMVPKEPTEAMIKAAAEKEK